LATIITIIDEIKQIEEDVAQVTPDTTPLTPVAPPTTSIPVSQPVIAYEPMTHTVNNYTFSLSAKGRTLVFPMNPESWSVNRSSAGSTQEMLNRGQIIIPKPPQLAEYSWSGLLPVDLSFPGAKDIKDMPNMTKYTPMAFIQDIWQWQDSANVLTFALARVTPDNKNLGPITNQVLITQFDIAEEGGEDVGDIHYNITLTQYREYQPTYIGTTATTLVPVIGERVAVSGSVYANSFGFESNGNASKPKSAGGRSGKIATLIKGPITKTMGGLQRTQKYLVGVAFDDTKTLPGVWYTTQNSLTRK
jgi:hypothetical protein